jgi:hypothetical protein
MTVQSRGNGYGTAYITVDGGSPLVMGKTSSGIQAYPTNADGYISAGDPTLISVTTSPTPYRSALSAILFNLAAGSHTIRAYVSITNQTGTTGPPYYNPVYGSDFLVGYARLRVIYSPKA